MKKNYELVEEKVVSHQGSFKFGSDLFDELKELLGKDFDFDKDDDYFYVLSGTVDGINETIKKLVDNGYNVKLTSEEGEQDCDFLHTFTFNISKPVEKLTISELRTQLREYGIFANLYSLDYAMETYGLDEDGAYELVSDAYENDYLMETVEEVIAEYAADGSYE